MHPESQILYGQAADTAVDLPMRRIPVFDVIHSNHALSGFFNRTKDNLSVIHTAVKFPNIDQIAEFICISRKILAADTGPAVRNKIPFHLYIYFLISPCISGKE